MVSSLRARTTHYSSVQSSGQQGMWQKISTLPTGRKWVGGGEGGGEREEGGRKERGVKDRQAN